MRKKKIAVIGEFYLNSETHTALNNSLDYLKKHYNFEYNWIDTEKVKENILSEYSGIWSAPGSPFKSLDGALAAISYAREKNIPHLGTCAGFQHSIIEIARNILNIEDAQHEEYDTEASKLFISRLTNSLAGKTMDVFLKDNTISQKLYGNPATKENYYCNFAINPDFKSFLNHPKIIIAGTDQDSEIRIIELKDQKFFVITLFVPQTKSKPENPHPLIKGFVETVCE